MCSQDNIQEISDPMLTSKDYDAGLGMSHGKFESKQKGAVAMKREKHSRFSCMETFTMRSRSTTSHRYHHLILRTARSMTKTLGRVSKIQKGERDETLG